MLEPQPWRSYMQALSKRQTSGVAVRDLRALAIKPQDFPRLLVQVSCGGGAGGVARRQHRPAGGEAD